MSFLRCLDTNESNLSTRTLTWLRRKALRWVECWDAHHMTRTAYSVPQPQPLFQQHVLAKLVWTMF